MADEDIQLGVEADVDEAQVGAAGEQLGQILARRMLRGAQGAGLGREFGRLFSRAGAGAEARQAGEAVGANVVEGAARSIRQEGRRALGKPLQQILDDATAGLRVDFGNAGGGRSAFGGLGAGAKQAEEDIKSSSRVFRDRIDAMIADQEALEKRVRATFKTLQDAGADPDLFSVVNRQLRITQSVFRDLEQEVQSGTLGEERFERLARIVKESNATVQRETAGVQSTLRTFITTRQKELARANDAEDRLAQERLQTLKSESAERVIITQGEQNRLLAAEKAGQKERLLAVAEAAKLQRLAEREAIDERTLERRTAAKRILDAERTANAESVVESRTAGRLQVAAAQATSRRRIEIMRFTFRQIQALERGIAAVFRASSRVIGGLTGATAAGLSRLGGVFRRTNRDMNDGLQGALTRREQALSRSFRRQTDGIRAETARQQQAVDRLERNLSTGVFGVLSGRSRLGGALGAGALIGGGFTAGNLFTAGLDRFQQLERANLQLERLLGSATKARALLDDLNQWARGTPLALDLISEMAVGLLSMGTSADEVLPRLEAIADAVGFAGGGADEMRRVGLALRQVASQGRLVGEEFNQLAEALPGLNLAQLLADQLTDGDTAEFLRLRKAGEITADKFVEAFVAGVQNDPRIAGSTAAMADTLQGQISNLNSAWRRLGEALITEFEGPLRRSVARLRDNLDFLGRFVAGNVSEGFLRLRGAVVGVAVAMGALIAARAAVETLQLLGVAARFALTPFGALIVAVGALGAAIGALRVANDNFRYITDGIRDLASEQLGRGVGLLADALRRLGSLLASRVLPALRQFAEIVLNGVVVAARVVVAVFRALVIPAFQALFRFVVDTAIPAAVNLAQSIQQYLIPAAIALGAAWFALNAPISTVLATFAAIGAALYILRQQSDTVREFTDNLASSFVNLGQRLLDVSRTAFAAAGDVLRSLGAAFVDLLGGIDYERLGVAVLGFVNTLGRLLGQAITSRFVVDAAVKIGAAAIALAGSFIAGFVEGVIRGLPGAIDEFIATLGELLRAAGAPGLLSGLFGNVFTGIATIIVGSLLASSVLRSFTSAGSSAARAFSGGFLPGIRNIARTAEALRFPETAIRAQARDAAVSYQREFDRIMRNNRRLGTQSQLVQSGAISRNALDDQALRRLNAEQQRYIEGAGRATASAVLFRRTWSDALRDTGNRWQAVQDRVAQTGGWAAVGQRAGVALVTGFAAALAGQQGGTVGLIGVVSASLGALAVGGPVVAGITAAVGAASLLWNELTKADESAERLRETTEKMVDLFRELTGEDIGAELTKQLREATFAALDVAGDPEIATIIPTGFLSRAAEDIEAGNFQLERSFRDVLRNLNVSVDDINLAFARFEEDPEQFRRFLETPERIFSLLEGVGDRSDEVSRRTRIAFANIADALSETDLDPGRFVDFFTVLDEQAASFIAAQEVIREEARVTAEALANSFAVDRIGVGIQDIANQQLSALGRLERFDAVANAVQRVTGLIDRVGAVGVDAFAAVQEELTRTGITLDNDLIAYVRELIDAWIAAGEAADQAQQNFATDRIGLARFDGIGEVREQKIKINVDDGELEDAFDASGLLSDAISELNNQRTERLRGQIDTLRSALEGAEGAADRAQRALTDFITGGYNNSAQAQVDALIGNVGSIGSRIEEAFLQGGVRGQAAARSAIGDFGSQVASIIDAAIGEGITSQEQLRNLLAPVFAALGEETGDGFSRILSTVDFTEGITPKAAGLIIDELNRILAGESLETKVAGVFNARSEVERIQRELDRLEAELDVKVIFDESQIRQALTDAGASSALADAALASVNNLTAQQLGGLVAAVAAATAQFAPPQQASGGGNTTVINDNRQVTVNVADSGNPALTASQVVARANAAIAGGVVPTTGGSGFL